MMKIFKILGYSVTIRKIKEKKPHAMDTRAYGRNRLDRFHEVTESLRVLTGKISTKCN